MTAIFKLLCGLLCLVGACFGLNYQETSVIVCIYIWPILCDLMAFAGIFIWGNRHFTRRILTCGNIGIFVVFVYTTALFWQHYNVGDAFSLCVHDIEQIALMYNMTYAEVNIYIYVFLVLAIEAFYGFQLLLKRSFKQRDKNTGIINNEPSSIKMS